MIINTDKPEVSIVVPLYNEQENFNELTQRLKTVCSGLTFSTEVVLIDDGSRDQTPFLMYELGLTDKLFSCVFLSRNHGHQLAVTAGISSASATKAIFIIDGDLQDPPELINEFYSKLNEGNDVVFGVRKKRKESVNKVFLYWIYYRILRYISNVDVQIDSGDFSMISRRMADYMILMPEKSRYLRGMRSWIGFKQVGLEYERQARFAGEPKYTFKKLFELAYNGIFNFSDFPVKFITKVGGFTMAFSFLYIIYTIIKKYYFGGVPQGFTSLVIFIMLFTGIQLIALGILGEYITRIYIQVQNRPLFIIDKKIINGKIV